MDRKKKARAVFAKLQSQKPNKTCVDCDAYNPQWASVNNSCFFCIKCAGVHRSLGVHLSFVRSVGMDEWSDIQVESMKAGGNGQLLQFWRDQGFPENLPMQDKYDNDAMVAYRTYIKAKSRGENPSKPGKIGFKKRVRKKKNYAAQSVGSRGMSGGYKPQQSQGDPWASFTDSLSSVTSKISEQTREIDTTQLKSSVKSGWNNFSSWVSDAATKLAADSEDGTDDFAAHLRKNLGPSRKNMEGLGNGKIDADGSDDFASHLRRNLGPSRKKMEGLGSGSSKNAGNGSDRRRRSRETSSTSSSPTQPQQQRRKKKMPALSSKDYFSQEDQRSSAPKRNSNSGSKPQKAKKYGGLSSEDYFSQEVDSPELDKFYGKKKEDEFDGLGFSDDDDSQDKEEEVSDETPPRVLGKISAADDDDEDVDFDNFGWGDDDATKI